MSQASFHLSGPRLPAPATAGERDYIHQQLVAERLSSRSTPWKFIRARRLHGVYVDVARTSAIMRCILRTNVTPLPCWRSTAARISRRSLTENLRRNLQLGKRALFRSSFVSQAAKVFFHAAGEEKSGAPT